MKWLIYKHTNKINGKVYIGQTHQTEHERWKNGIGYKPYDDDRNCVFWNAICKYGWNNFKHEIVENNIKTLAKANKLEEKWIKKEHSYLGDPLCNGYNMTPGGNSQSYTRLRAIYQIQKRTLKIIKKYDSIIEAKKNFGGGSNISACLRGIKPTAVGFHWCYVDAYTSNWKPKDNLLVSPVFQIDRLTMKIVGQYESIKEAAEKTHGSRGGINQCCLKKETQSGGYFWCYSRDYSDDWKPYIGKFQRNKKIYCFENQKIYNNAKEASNDTKANRNHILRCCKGLENASNNLHFCYLEGKDTYKIKSNKDESPVVCVNTGMHYKTISEAGKLTNTNPRHISNCCVGREKTANGLTWCYENKYKKNMKPNKLQKKKIMCIETKIIYKSISEASRKTGIHRGTISCCCLNKKHFNTAGGYHWKYVD